MKKRHDHPPRHRNEQSLQPANPASAIVDVLLQSACAKHDAGQLAEAEALYRQILETSPNHAAALHLLGVIAYQVGKNEIAVQLIDRAIQSDPANPGAYFSRGNALYGLQQHQQAVESYDKAIQLKLEHPEAYNNRGTALHALKQFRAAVESYDNAILLKPDYVEAYSNRGSTLCLLQQYQEAAESCDQALRLRPNYPEAHCNRANVLLANQQYPAAIESYDRAIVLKPDYAKAFANRGNAFLALKLYPQALESYNQALALNPQCEYVQGIRMHVKGFLGDWDNFQDERQQLEASIDRGENAAPPFAILRISSSPAVQRRAAETYVGDQAPARSTAPMARRSRRSKIRVGYFSANYYNHPVSYLIAELLERHDRNNFEIVGFSFGPDTADELSKRVSAAMDRFLDVRSMTDRDVAQLSRKLEVDIAIDLMGFTQDSRPGIFAHRAAPIQVNFLGYPGTMAADYIDYIIADSTLIPETSRQHYAEKIVYLPDSFQANSRHPISEKQYSRSDEGLPEQGFIFCCFNNSYKICPATFAVWMRILQRAEGSVLWLLGGNPLTEANLRSQAEQRGIAPQRLFFARRLPFAEHLSRQRVADLFLDTLPFNAGATASPALWAGLPMLTCIGETFAGRMGASLLRAIDLPELVTSTEAEFEALAVRLVRDTQHYQAIRHRLEHNRLTSPLFDSSTFARHLEAAYTAMFDRHHAGLPPDHIQISRIQKSYPQPDPAFASKAGS